MTRFDIVIKTAPEQFYVVANRRRNYDIVLGDKHHLHDIYISSLVKKQNIDDNGDIPFILRLTGQSIDCLLDVDFLGEYNRSVLKENTIGVKEILLAALKENLTNLTSSFDTVLTEALNTNHCDLILSTSGEATDTTAIKPLAHNVKIKTSFNKVSDIMSKVTEAILDTDGSKMSVLIASGETYLKLSLNLNNTDAKLRSITESFITISNITDTIDSTACLKINASPSYLMFCLCKPVSTCMEADEIASDVWIFTDISEMNEKLSTEIRQGVHALLSLDAAFSEGVETSIDDSLEIHYGFSHYDNEYLCYWDNYTLTEMEEELQGG